MKAYVVGTKDEFERTVVFAETAGKARNLARYTDACEDADFCDIEVHRSPKLDKYYKKGKVEMEWDNSEDRIALVKEANFRCEFAELDLCEGCAAREFCGTYEEYMIESTGMFMEQIDLRRKLRGYLKGFRDCQTQAKEIEKMLASGGVPDIVRDPLLKAKEDFELQCKNVQLIIGYTKSGLERRIFNDLYIFGKPMRRIAKETGYSYGHCANTEMKAVIRLCGQENVLILLPKR